MRIELPGRQPQTESKPKQNIVSDTTAEATAPKKEFKKKPVQKERKKVDPSEITWRENNDSISARIGGQIVYIDINTYDIQMSNGFVIKSGDLDEAKSKSILLFNN